MKLLYQSSHDSATTTSDSQEVPGRETVHIVQAETRQVKTDSLLQIAQAA